MPAIRQFFTQYRATIVLALLFALLMVAAMPVGASEGPAPLPFSILAQLSLDLNLDPLWTSVNTYFPIFLGIVAIGGGIAIAIAISRFVINALLAAFRG